MPQFKYNQVQIDSEAPQTKTSNSKCCRCWGRYIAAIVILLLVALNITFGVLWGKRVNPFSSTKYAVEKGVIGFPISLPNDGTYIEWTFLQLNDVYEMLPMDNNRKGGLARVAHLRKLLLDENPRTYTFLAGDLISPSALNQAMVNGSELNGQQMIESFNAIGLDFMTFGNHEFDFGAESVIIQRMDESKFTWISTNVLDRNTNKPYHTSIQYHVLEIESVRILIFGLTVYVDKPYVRIIDEKQLIPFVQQFLKSISNVKYDVLVALTHLNIETDKELLENIPEIDLIIGGHEHQDYHLHRGSQYSPIYKADANAFSVYIHRCAFNLDQRRFRIYSTLAFVTPDVQEDENTRDVVNHWHSLAVDGFKSMGYDIDQVVSCLPDSVELDGRFSSVRNFATLLSNLTCECMMYASNDTQTIAGLFDSGSIRNDDIIRGKVTQYDVLRILPYQNPLYALSVPGQILAQVLDDGLKEKGRGMYITYGGAIQRNTQDNTWRINGQDISKSGLNYNIATMSYARMNTKLNDTSVIILKTYPITQTKSLIDYLPTKYPPC